jgi:hypothetical protein
MTVRTTRARIIWLKNDYKDIMNRIEKGLHEHHASMQAARLPKEEGIDVPAGPAGERHSEPVLETPFATVNTVESGSPAHEANLKAGDRIRTFGAANWTNHENLRKVAEVVQRNEGVRTLSHQTEDTICSLLSSATNTCQGREGLPRAPASSDTASQLGWKRNSWLSHPTNLRKIPSRRKSRDSIRQDDARRDETRNATLLEAPKGTQAYLPSDAASKFIRTDLLVLFLHC